MARTHVAVIVGATLFALLAAYQLLSTFTSVSLDISSVWSSGPVQDGTAQKAAFSVDGKLFSEAFPDSDDLKKKATGSQYLLGVGKADITG